MSVHNRELSSHSLGLIRRVTIEIGNDAAIVDSENFQDIRMELNSTGHNLTSVLINPRETLIEDIFDEFAFDQSAPLEYQSPFSNINGSSNTSMISQSIHNALTGSSPSFHSGSGGSGYSSSLFTMTNNESEQLQTFIIRMNKIFTMYTHAHYGDHHNATSPRGNHDANLRVYKKHNDDLRSCYNNVPELFFRPDFSLLNQAMFSAVFQTVDPEAIIGRMRDIRNGVQIAVEEPSKTVEDHLSVYLPPTTASAAVKSKKKQSRGHDPNDPNTNVMVLQDKLSVYLDLVEMALLRQIYARAPSFFRTLDDIKSLQFSVSDTTRHLIHGVRGKLQSVDVHVSEHSLAIPKLYRRQANMSVLAEKLAYMQQVISARASILLLLDSEDYIAALELISVSKGVYFAQQLDGIAVMRGIGNQLNEFDNLVCEIMCNKFVSMAIQWEDEVAQNKQLSGGSSENSGINGSDMSQLYEEFQTSTKPSASLTTAENSLRQLLHSLVVTERVQSALNMYKHRLLEAIRLIVRTCVMEYLVNFDPSIAYGENDFEDNAEQGGDTPFGQRVREMSHDNFLSCLSMCFEHVIMSLQKASVFHRFIEAELSDNSSILAADGSGKYNSSSRSNSNSDLSKLTVNTNFSNDKFNNGSNGHNRSSSSASPADTEAAAAAQRTLRSNMIVISKQCLAAACDLTQKSVKKLVQLRQENNCKMSPAQMKSLWGSSLTFILQLEDIYVSTAYILRQQLLSQTTYFLKYIHNGNLLKLANTLENERFIQCDVSRERQEEINRLVSGKTFLATSTTTPTTDDAHSLHSLAAAAAVPSSSVHGSFKASLKDKQAKPVVVDGSEFKVVWSALLLVECIMTYLEIACHFSPVTDIVLNCIDELLQLFDNRTNQLVLGAQAIQSAARLKSISAKHLAITGQSISLIITLVPHVRAALLAQLPLKQQMLLMRLETVTQKYNDHHNQIVAKFVSIVSDFVDSSTVKLRAYNWDRNNEEPCEYFTELKKNITSLHTVLMSVLPVNQIQDVFGRIFALLSRKIRQHFEEVMPLEPAGKDRILDAISTLMVDFTKLRHLDVTVLSATLMEHFRVRYDKKN